MHQTILSCHRCRGALRRNKWGLLFVFSLYMAGSVAWGDLADLDKPADAEVLQDRVDAISRQIRSRPDAAAFFVQRGEAYFKLREFDKAIDDYSTAIRLDDRQLKGSDAFEFFRPRSRRILEV